MLRLAIDENLNNDIVRGLLRRRPGLDLKRVQDARLAGADDPEVLEGAARENRILPTHDVRTMTEHARQRVAARKPMPGVFEISLAISVSRAIEDILLLVDCSLENEWDGQVRYLPL
jgi:hypothetical protein